MGDLVIKIRSSDETGPGVQSVTKGMTRVAETAEVMAQKVQRSWKPTGGAFGDLRGAVQAQAQRMVRDTAMTGSTDDVETMSRQMQLYERSASAYARSVNTKLQALSMLSIAEEESAVESTMRLSRTISQEEQLVNRAAGRRLNQAQSVSKGSQMAMQQAIFGLDDAMTGFTNGGLKGAMIGAGNNITMVASMLGGVKTQLMTIGAISAVQLGISLYNSLQKTRDGARELRDELDGVRKAANRIGTDPIRLRHLDDEISGMSSKALQQQRVDSQLTVSRSRESIAALENQLAKAEQLARSAEMDPRLQRAGTGISWKSEEDRLQTAKSARQEAESIADKVRAARNTERAAQEFLTFTEKNNSVAQAVAREEAEAAEKRMREEEKNAREVERRGKLLDRQRRELDRLKGQQNKFLGGLFGDQSTQDGILSDMDARLSEARKLFHGAPDALASSEEMITKITEEKLAKLALDQRPNVREARNPTLALANSDRAREIVFGAGNQSLDAKTKIDKHNSAMEQLTGQVAAGIKELVAEAKKDIEVVLAED